MASSIHFPGTKTSAYSLSPSIRLQSLHACLCIVSIFVMIFCLHTVTGSHETKTAAYLFIDIHSPSSADPAMAWFRYLMHLKAMPVITAAVGSCLLLALAPVLALVYAWFLRPYKIKGSSKPPERQ